MDKKNGFLSADKIKALHDSYLANRQRQVIGQAIAKSGLQAAAYQNTALREQKHHFSCEVETLPVTNQKASGRCWLFAGLNLMREPVARQYNLEDFELSQNYLAFWDKFEKINYFLETVLSTLEEPAEGRLISWLMTSYQDGGQWDMFVNLVEKYGVIPKQAMPETYHSSSTNGMNQIIVTALRKAAADYRRQYKDGTGVADLRIQKEKLVAHLYGTLCQCFGEPPQRFDWEYTDKDKKYGCQRDLDPDRFYKEIVKLDLKDYVSIIHAPTGDKPYGRTFTVKHLGNVVEGQPILYYNLPMDELKSFVIRQLESGQSVWFGSDVGHAGDRENGAWMDSLYDYESLLDLDLQLSKADMLDYRHSAMNHAMLLTGVNLVDGRPNRWKIENSWGDKTGKKGYYIADDAWFGKYVYQIIVEKKYLQPEQLAALAQPPIELEPWDPMGTLA